MESDFRSQIAGTEGLCTFEKSGGGYDGSPLRPCWSICPNKKQIGEEEEERPIYHFHELSDLCKRWEVSPHDV